MWLSIWHFPAQFSQAIALDTVFVFDFSFWLVWTFCNFFAHHFTGWSAVRVYTNVLLLFVCLSPPLCLYACIQCVHACVCACWKARANILKRLAFEWNWKVKCKLRLNLHKVSLETFCNIQIFSYTSCCWKSFFSLSLSCVHSTTWFTMWNGAEFIRVLYDAQTILIIFPIVFCNVAISPSNFHSFLSLSHSVLFFLHSQLEIKNGRTQRKRMSTRETSTLYSIYATYR